MVLENIISVKQTEKNPIYAFFLGVMLTSIAILLGYRVFLSNAGLATIAFIIMGSMPFLRKLISIEEKEEAQANTFKKAFKRNEPIIWLFLNFYLGIALTYFLVSSFLSPELSEILFKAQQNVFSGSITYSLDNFDLAPIIGNNLGIILLSLILSLLYGVGAVFIITWNASVLGTFLAYKGFPALLKYLPHATVEFLAFFMAAIAGSILSEAIEKKDYKGDRFKNILRDVGLLVSLSVALIIIAAVIEVSVI